ncbi:MAG TPA: metallophosphoesterase [Burkholderiaceae bacterium]|nr:metallophosphoesterase [Burkholderiaceae bacterium]
MSDLHIEFHPFVIPPLPDDARTVLVLAGDIGVIHRKDELHGFLQCAADQFRAVIYVMGNHEYYAGVWPDARETLISDGLPDNVHVLEQDWIDIDGVQFAGTTLWSDFENGDTAAMQAAQVMNDFHYIRVSADDHDTPRALLPEDILADHRQSLQWLDRTLTRLQANDKPVVVVTHHGVSQRSIHDDYANSPVNGAFLSACDWLFAKHVPALAIHGHVHNSFDYRLPDASGGLGTRVLVNPRGYTRRDDTQETPLFDPFLTVDIHV